MRRFLLIGAASAALLVWSTPAQADLTMKDLDDAVKKPFRDFSAYLMYLVTRAERLPEYLIRRELNSFWDAIGFSPRSWLRDWISLSDLYPQEPFIYTVVDSIERAVERYEDRTTRVEEAMMVASGITESILPNQDRLMALTIQNRDPVGWLAADQIGNEINLSIAGSMDKLIMLTAELGQLEADERAKEDWVQQQSVAWNENHYGDNGMWTGVRIWTPETMGVR